MGEYPDSWLKEEIFLLFWDKIEKGTSQTVKYSV